MGFLIEITEFLADLWQFLKERQKYWLAPLIFTLILIGLVIVFTQGSAIAPFIYAIF
ncbi:MULTISPECIES: DUF5989 family protein [unclassified Leptolyngbya]|uniref:DUF5989 family protein n=1 Tax=unclassified Leptolyngbya TaxID=2650499 RepID=UPI001689FA32|nr:MULTISPECIES: DUF5989 family protein [unclassified Leptolyngbya]MBD1911789.1 hypothetical protein [Leptolyngbya sp. FACHB-8]MBD2153321.1 hypothetical protein [Leptolyngbya sp. FACHB-16]